MIISEQEKNRIRGLHGIGPVVMSEQDKKWYQFWKKNTEQEKETPRPGDDTSIIPDAIDNLPPCSDVEKYKGWEFVKTEDPRGPVPGAPMVKNLEGITFSHYTAIDADATTWAVAFKDNKAFCKVTS